MPQKKKAGQARPEPQNHPMSDPAWVVKKRGVAKRGFDTAHLKAARAQALAAGRGEDWPERQNEKPRSNDNAAKRMQLKRKAPAPDLKPESAKRRAPKRMKLAAKRVKEIAPVFSRLKERVRGEQSLPEQKLSSEFDRERE